MTDITDQQAADTPARYRRLLSLWLFRLIWIPVFTAECVAQFVFHRQDIVTVLAAVLLSVLAIRWALVSAAETANRRAGGGEQ